MRLIDADVLEQKFFSASWYDNRDEDIAWNTLNIEPTIGSTTQGHWFFTEYDYFDCSVCGEAYYNGAESTAQAKHYLEQGYAYAFCPHCGAKMIKHSEQ